MRTEYLVAPLKKPTYPKVAPQKKPTYPTVANLKKLHIAITSILVDSVEKTDLDEETQKAEKAYGLLKFNQPSEFRPDMVSSGSEEVEEVVENVEEVDTIEVTDKVKEPEIEPKEVESVADKVADEVDTVEEVVEKV